MYLVSSNLTENLLFDQGKTEPESACKLKGDCTTGIRRHLFLQSNFDDSSRAVLLALNFLAGQLCVYLGKEKCLSRYTRETIPLGYRGVKYVAQPASKKTGRSAVHVRQAHSPTEFRGPRTSQDPRRK